MVTFLVLLIFSYNVIFLFVGTASLGLFLSSTFPSMLAYTEDILQYRGEGWTGLLHPISMVPWALSSEVETMGEWEQVPHGRVPAYVAPSDQYYI